MTSLQTAIVADYEQNSATPEQIAESLELDIIAVKATLMQYSGKYRDQFADKTYKTHNPELSEDISSDEYDEILRAYKNIAFNSEHDHIRERALRNLINERKGRNDIKKENLVKAGGTFNVITFNRLIVESRQKALQNAIDVGAVDIKQIEDAKA